MFGPTLVVTRMASIWYCILYLREDAVCFIVFGNQTFCFILRIEICKVVKIQRTDSLEDENCIVTSFLLSRHSMPPRERAFFFFIDGNLEHTKSAIFL